MRELSFSNMETAKGGNSMEEVKGGCYWTTYAGFALATIGLFAAPFTGGISMGLLAFGGFIISAYETGSCN